MSDDLMKRLHSLHKQATVERSHFYVGSCAEDAMHRIEELEDILAVKRKRILTVESDKIDLAFKLAKALAELERLGFDFESTVGRKLKGQDDE